MTSKDFDILDKLNLREEEEMCWNVFILHGVKCEYIPLPEKEGGPEFYIRELVDAEAFGKLVFGQMEGTGSLEDLLLPMARELKLIELEY